MGPAVLLHVLHGVRRRRDGRVGGRGDRADGDIRRVRRGQLVHRVGRAPVPRDAHRHQLFPAQPDRGRPAVRRHHARAGLRARHARLAVRRLRVPRTALLAVCVRFRAAVDADADQHGPAPVHRRAAVSVAADPPTSSRSHRGHVAHRARRVHAGAVLVPRAVRPERHHKHMHAGVPQERHVPHVDRVHRVRGVAVVRAAAVAVRLPLPADIPQAEQDPQAHRAVLRLAPDQGRVAEQPVAARRRRHAAGAGAARGGPVPETRARGARAAGQRDRRAGHVAANHRGDVSDLRGRQPGHGGHGVLPALAPLHHGPAVRAAQHRRQPHSVRRAVRELPQVLRPAVVHIEAPAGREPRAAGQHEPGRRRQPDAQLRPLRRRRPRRQRRRRPLGPAAGQLRVRGRAARHRRVRLVVRHQRVLVTMHRCRLNEPIETLQYEYNSVNVVVSTFKKGIFHVHSEIVVLIKSV